MRKEKTMNEEMIKRAREAKSPGELLRIAHESGLTEFTADNAEFYFNILKTDCEVSDEELESSVGGCTKGGQTVVTCDKKCHTGKFKASYYYAGGKMYFYEELPDMGLRKMWATLTAGNSKPEYLNKCGACKYLTFKNAVGCCGAE